MIGLCDMDDILDVYVRLYAGAIGTRSSLWTTTIDFIVPGWLWSNCSRRTSSVWTGQHAHLISSRSSMFGTCYRWRICDVHSNQRLSWNLKMSQSTYPTLAGRHRRVHAKTRTCGIQVPSNTGDPGCWSRSLASL